MHRWTPSQQYGHIPSSMREHTLCFMYTGHQVWRLNSDQNGGGGHGARRRETGRCKGPSNWRNFLGDNGNKTDLFNFLAAKIQQMSSPNMVIVTKEENARSNHTISQPRRRVPMACRFHIYSLNCRYLQFNWRYIQLNWRYLQLICRYLQFNWIYLQIGWIVDIFNWIGDIYKSIGDISKYCLFGDISNWIVDISNWIVDIYNSVKVTK